MLGMQIFFLRVKALSKCNLDMVNNLVLTYK